MKRHTELDYSLRSEKFIKRTVRHYITGQSQKNLWKICLETGFMGEF